MGRSGGRDAKEVERIVADFERSGLNRREYCEQRGIARPTLDWYRRRVRGGRDTANLVPVKVVNPARSVATTSVAVPGFTLVLLNGCRIESGWSFDEQELTRLIRIAGAA